MDHADCNSCAQIWCLVVTVDPMQVRDIYDDLITRTAEGSDAVACSQVCKCCHPRCVGVQFWVIAFAFQCLGLYIALVWLASTPPAKGF